MTTNNSHTHTHTHTRTHTQIDDWMRRLNQGCTREWYFIPNRTHVHATGYNQLWTAYPCMQATRGVLNGGNPWLTLAPSSSRVVTTWRFFVPMTQANTSGVNSSRCSFSSWNKDTKIQGYKDTMIQGCKDISLPVTLERAQEFVLVTCHSYTSLTIRQNITVRNNRHN